MHYWALHLREKIVKETLRYSPCLGWSYTGFSHRKLQSCLELVWIFSSWETTGTLPVSSCPLLSSYPSLPCKRLQGWYKNKVWKIHTPKENVWLLLPLPHTFYCQGNCKEETRYKPGFTLSQLCNTNAWLLWDTQVKTSANYATAEVGETIPVNLSQSYRNSSILILIQDVCKWLQIAKPETKP